MRAGSSVMFESGVVILEESDFPMSVERVMAAARGDHEAVRIGDGGEEWFTVRTPEDCREAAYLEDDLRRKMRHLNGEYANSRK